MLKQKFQIRYSKFQIICRPRIKSDLHSGIIKRETHRGRQDDFAHMTKIQLLYKLLYYKAT